MLYNADFRWNDWNVEHIGRHGVVTEEAEWIVNRFVASDAGEDKYKVWGRTAVGRYLQVIFVLDPDDVVFVIHARELTKGEKKNFRRRQR